MKLYSKTLLLNIKVFYYCFFVLLFVGLLSPSVASATDFYIKGGKSEICEGDKHQYYYLHSKKFDKHDKYEWKIENYGTNAYIKSSKNKRDVTVHPGDKSGKYKLICIIKRKSGRKYYTYYASTYIKVNPKVYVDAGPDKTVCYAPGVPIDLDGIIKGCKEGGKWYVEKGSGSISNAYSAENATYTPTQGDLYRGYAILKLIAKCYSKCGNSYDYVKIYFKKPAYAPNPGGPYATCGTAPVTLASVAGATWSVDAAYGSFSGNVFTASDAAVGTTVTVTLTANSYCGPVSKTTTVRVDRPATANAGPDQTVYVKEKKKGELEDVVVDLAGSIGGSASSGSWATSGSGTFTPNANTVAADYVPSDADIRSGSVTLTLTTNDPNSGNVCPAASDAVVINFKIIEKPECHLELYARVRKIKVDEYGNIIKEGSIDLEVKGGSDYYEYKWFHEGKLISDKENLKDLTSPGKYRVVVIDKKTGCKVVCRFIVKVKPYKPCGCKDDDEETYDKGEDDTEETASTAARVATSSVAPENVSLSVFPNTVETNATIQFTLDKPSSYSLEVVNSLGQVVRVIADGKADAGKVINYKLDANLLDINKVNFVRVRTVNKVTTFKVLRR